MGGVTLENYRRALESNRQTSSTSTFSDKTKARSKPLPPPINTNLTPARPPPIPAKEVKQASSFSAPTNVQHTMSAAEKRPAGTRITSDTSALSGTQTATEIQKSKERLSLWKKPVSGLLMRRKATQNAPDIRPLPLPQKPNESTFDPRIKGTRVHDFSAPRQRVVPTRKPTVPGAEVWTGWEAREGYSQAAPVQSNTADLPLRSQTEKSAGTAPDTTVGASSDAGTQKSMDLSKEPSKESTRQIDQESPDDKPLPEHPFPERPPPVPPSTKDDESARSLSTKSRPLSTASSIIRTNPSTRTNKSRPFSLSESSIRDSFLPKHMKSTSSRFSFDMMGAARAEKLLEERHRQKELERKANDPGPTNRDSRFDEFDEDNFDWDAAMDDDGLEERIPGVNADYEEDSFLDEEDPFEEDIPMIGDVEVIDEEEDPDNDQENFAGFIFSRSNPQSSLVSPATPAMIATPRDASGRPIGHAITKDTTPDILSTMSPLPTEDILDEKHEDDAVRLADHDIQELQAPPKAPYNPAVFQERRHMLPVDDLAGSTSTHENELYFDRGLREELEMAESEIQESTIDESIFDIDDTDQFGRPIPGAFAQAMKAVKEQEQKKRESDITSHSVLSASTAHTSVSMGLQSFASTEKPNEPEDSNKDLPPPTSPSQSTEDKVAAYLQQALAKAAVSDLESRWDDATESALPPGDPDLMITSPTTGSQPNSAGLMDDPSSHIYDDDGFGRGFDDGYDDDDDYGADFIAEANAEALAYDSEGFYGQEFGFYSAPVQQTIHLSAPNNGPVGSENMYGGYFGPSGSINRSASGHVTREPNLTPITERSEYSNRNSILSPGLPSAALPSAGLDGRSLMQSPGLSTLMGMGMDDGDFSLTGLYRLRNKAFGGSQISLSSSRDGSPRSERAPAFEERHAPPWEAGRPQSHLGFGSSGPPHHARKNSNYSIRSNSDVASDPSSPNVTSISIPNHSVPPPPLNSPPPIPQSSSGQVPQALQCPPVMEDEGEESPARNIHVPGDVSPARTLKGIPALAGGASTPASIRRDSSSDPSWTPTLEDITPVLAEIARNKNGFYENANLNILMSDSSDETNTSPTMSLPPAPLSPPPAPPTHGGLASNNSV